MHSIFYVFVTVLSFSQLYNIITAYLCEQVYRIQNPEQCICCAVAEDGSYIAVATSDQKIIICHPQTRQVVSEFCEPSG